VNGDLRSTYCAKARATASILAALRDDEISANWIALGRIRAGAPCEWGWFARKGLFRDPRKRYASAGAMLAELRRVQQGVIPVDCNVTMAKRSLHEVSFWIDRHGFVFHALTGLAVLAALAAIGLGARAVWHLAMG
jgi:hypothetical protein